MTDYKKIITTINSITPNLELTPIDNDVIVIDTSNNRIGINTLTPEEAIHVSGGTIKTQKLSVIGDLSVNGVLFTPEGEVSISDDRYKHNEKIITNGLEIIRKLQPQTYDKTRTFKDIDFQGVVNEAHIKEAGLIAQELYDINDLSFAVIPGNDTEPYGVRYNNVFIFGLAAVKELDTIVSNLSEKVSNISNEPHDISNTNLSNILDFVKNQNKLIQTLNEKITNLEKRII